MGALSNLAMGLYGTSSPDTHKIFKLTSTTICINLLGMIRARSPRLGKFLTSIAPVVVLGIAIVKLFGQGSALSWILGHIRSRIMPTVTIPNGHPLLQPVMKWMTTQGMKTTARDLTLKQKSKYDRWSSGKEGRDDEENGKRRDLLECQPDSGRYFFRFGTSWLMFHVHTKKVESATESGRIVHVANPMEGLQISIACLSIRSGTRPVQEFLRHVEAIHAASKHTTTTIYRPSQGKKEMEWAGVSRPSRPLDSVTLADDKKIPLVRDIESYLTKETQLFYASRGIPLRRGYLLYGPPGTGKSSFSAAIAGHFGLDLFVVNLTTPGLDDKGLEDLFDALPDRCVCLVEDVDSAGIQRENIRQAPKTSEKAKADDKARVTLSGLLNVLDGPCSAEGRVLLLTTNTPDSLDPAMVRPGRIDMKVYLGYADIETAATMFRHIFLTTPQQCDCKASAMRKEYIDSLAKAFAASIPSDMFTPAEVQGYLMIHRSNPEDAVGKAKEWVAELLETRARGSNVASHSNFSGSDGDGESQDNSAENEGDIAEGENVVEQQRAIKRRVIRWRERCKQRLIIIV